MEVECCECQKTETPFVTAAMLKFVSTKPPRLKYGHMIEGPSHDSHMGSHMTGADYSFDGNNMFVEGKPVDRGNYTYSEMRGLTPSYDRGLTQSYESDNRGQGGAQSGPSSYSEMRGISQNKENLYKTDERWRAYNKRYGKIGLEKEIVTSSEPPYVVPLYSKISHADNRPNLDTNYNPIPLESTADPGYVDIDDIRNANVQPYSVHGYRADPSSDSVPRSSSVFPVGRGHGEQVGAVRPHSFSPDSAINRQYRLINGSMQGPQRFSVPTPYTSGTGGSYGPPYNLDSTGSMSVDSVSTIGDRSWKSMSETMDFDTVDSASDIRQGLNPTQPLADHEHVHVGRGTHGLCESPATSPVRPGTSASEGHMTSSLRRKNSSLRSGHRVRWDPGVVNSGHAEEGKQDHEPPKQEQQPKKKKRTSFRSLLNFPKFLSDDEGTDYSSDSGFTSKVAKQSEQKYRKKKNVDSEYAGEPKKGPELASLRYRIDFGEPDTHHVSQIDDTEKVTHASEGYVPRSSQGVIRTDSSVYDTRRNFTRKGAFDNVDFVTGLKLYESKEDLTDRTGVNVSDSGFKISDTSHVMGLYVTRASDQSINTAPYSYDLSGSGFGPNEGISKEIESIHHPVMHSGFHTKPQIFQKKDGYIKPELKQTRNINSVQPYIINGQQKDLEYQNYSKSGLQTDPISVSKENFFSSSQIASDISYTTEKLDTNLGQNALNDSVPVTFDTFVTFGGPSSSNITFDRFVTLGRPYATSTPVPNGPTIPSWRLEKDGYRYKTETERGLESVSGPFQTKVTESWKYGGSVGPSVPKMTHAVYGSVLDSEMAVSQSVSGFPGHVSKPLMSHDKHVTHGQMYGQQEGPYLMQNKEYGKISSPLTTFMTFFGGPPKVPKELTNQSQGQSHDMSGSDTLTSKFSDSGTFSQKDGQDYDDVLLSEFLRGLEEKKQSTRRKLVYTEPENKVGGLLE